MKSRSTILFVLVLAFTWGQAAEALCIGCGCQRLYDTCIDNDGRLPREGREGLGLVNACTRNNVTLESCCSEHRRACHGTGINISISGLFGFSSFEVATMNDALSGFDTVVSEEIRERMVSLEEASATFNYEQQAVDAAVLNALTPLLTEEERAAVTIAFDEVPLAWTRWLNRDGPSGTGDWETLSSFIERGEACASPLGIECRTLEGEDWRQTGQIYTCDPTVGGICRNRDQLIGTHCLDYEVRFLCRSVGS